MLDFRRAGDVYFLMRVGGVFRGRRIHDERDPRDLDARTEMATQFGFREWAELAGLLDVHPDGARAAGRDGHQGSHADNALGSGSMADRLIDRVCPGGHDAGSLILLITGLSAVTGYSCSIVLAE